MKLNDFRMDVKAALTEPPPHLDYVLPGFLASSVGALVGPGAAGKTMLLMQTACDIAAGAPVSGGILTADFLAEDGAPVVFLLAEESRAVMHHRLQSAIQNVQSMKEFQNFDACRALVERLNRNLHIYPMGGAGRLVQCGVGTANDEMKAMAATCEDARLVIIDPLRRFHSGEENDAAHMTVVVEAFERLATTTGAAVILSHHTNRSSALAGAGELASASRGSSALTDGVRWQANLSVVNEQTAARFGISEIERRCLVRLDIAKANYTAAAEPTLLRRDPSSGVLSVWREPRAKPRERLPRPPRTKSNKPAVARRLHAE
ncbi:helicase RepA family protein [Paraburkholderia sp. USG1]|uniref:helicase RepA family protein n=1 Tax=Paraburkholderia sp. USG1 TaxID=2952268 RepID=UPI00286418DD|nr:helicase RepA family protein [Paraburkholderia sp. USG1]MDR8402246.1 helicase RepA family protein [Paraburkholderia sp. USG1]